MRARARTRGAFTRAHQLPLSTREPSRFHGNLSFYNPFFPPGDCPAVSRRETISAPLSLLSERHSLFVRLDARLHRFPLPTEIVPIDSADLGSDDGRCR